MLVPPREHLRTGTRYIDAMSMDAAPPIETVRAQGFAFVPGATMRALLERIGPLDDWAAFASSWNDLELDRYLEGHGRYRRRRHAVFRVENGTITRAPHQPHYQALEYNALQGGIERWFEPIAPAVASGNSMTTVLRFCRDAARTAIGHAGPWHVEVHQFRIEARAGEPGQPTPEGAHRDGVDFVLVLMIRRENIASGTTTILDPQQRVLGSFTLTEPLDAALVDDRRVCHGVTAVTPLDRQSPAYRDVLVVTFRSV
jgi:hypothetical protein